MAWYGMAESRLKGQNNEIKVRIAVQAAAETSKNIHR